MSENKALIAKVTEVMREADIAFEKTGGGTRHYVRDLLLPIMEAKGLVITDVGDISAPPSEASIPEEIKQDTEYRFQEGELTTCLSEYQKRFNNGGGGYVYFKEGYRIGLSQLSSIKAERDLALKDARAWKGQAGAAHEAFRKAQDERDAALKEVADYREALGRYSKPEYINQYIVHGSESKSWPAAAVSAYAQITLNKYKKEEQK